MVHCKVENNLRVIVSDLDCNSPSLSLSAIVPVNKCLLFNAENNFRSFFHVSGGAGESNIINTNICLFVM